MTKTQRTLRKIGIASLGFPLLIVGLILVPLPGPGLLLCLAALLILSAEFDWVKPYLEKTRAALDKVKMAVKDKMAQADRDKS